MTDISPVLLELGIKSRAKAIKLVLCRDRRE